MSETSAAPTQHVEIVIAGAGFSGLGMAIALREEGVEDFLVLERSDDLGGTWHDNRYPGCACDIPSVLYSLTADQNPGWSQAFAGQPEIEAYMHDVARRHDLRRHLRFGHEVLSADWDEAQQHWTVQTSQGRVTADTLISAAGALADPALPAIKGLDTFTGTVFHSARWNHDHDLRGRRVAVVGTGASAIQFVPEIQPEVGHLTLFQRTPPWILPRENPRIPPRWRERFARHPWLLDALRRGVFAVHDSLHVGFSHPTLMRAVERVGRRHLARQVADPALRAKLTPDYRLGCKRILRSNDWYPALCAENAEVVTSGVREVTPNGIIDADGRTHEVDTIIFGTGFQVTDPPISHRIRGRDGRTLAQSWQGSPQAHLGMAVAGYPNLFLLLGPNTGLGHNSVLLMIEAQISHLRQLLAHRRARGAVAVEPRPERQAAFVREVDRGSQGSVWTAGGCLNWYTDDTGRNSALWPGSVRAYQRRLRRLDPDDWVLEMPRPSREREIALV